MTTVCFDSSVDCVLTCVVEDAHEQARDVLAGGDAPLAAVVWLSAHLAAVARTISPAARSLGESPAAVTEIRRRDLELERMLRVAERRHSGDALAAGLDAERLRDVLVDRLDRHAETEHARLAALAGSLSREEQAALATRYLDALAKAPTRPHPHLPHAGVAGAVAFRVEAMRDHVHDTLDGRHVPLPRAPRVMARPGRWGSYLLGRMQASEDDAAR
jgi:hypothetical protein